MASTQHCPCCGASWDSAEVAAAPTVHEIVLSPDGDVGASGPSDRTGHPQRIVSRRSRTRSVAALAIGAVALAGTLVAVSGPDPPPDVAQPTPVELPTPAPLDDGRPDPERAAAIAALVALDIRVAYVGRDGAVIVDPAIGDARLVDHSERTARLAYDDGLLLLSSDRRTLAVDPARPDRVAILSTRYRLEPGRSPGEFVFLPAAVPDGAVSEVFVGHRDDGSIGRRLAIPPQSTYLAVPDVGLLVLPPTGGTYLAGVTSFDLLSPHRVVAATRTARIEVRCDDALICETVLVSEDPGHTDGVAEVVVPMPAALAAGSVPPLLSPDGRWVLWRGDGTSPPVLHDTATGSVRELVVEAPTPLQSMGTPAWTPDSRAVVWVGPVGSPPRIHVVFTDDGGDLRLDLGLDADVSFHRSNEALAVFS